MKEAREKRVKVKNEKPNNVDQSTKMEIIQMKIKMCRNGFY